MIFSDLPFIGFLVEDSILTANKNELVTENIQKQKQTLTLFDKHTQHQTQKTHLFSQWH